MYLAPYRDSSSVWQVNPEHFGVNYLANREDRFNQGIEGDNLFGEAADLLGATGYRYPGGSIAERNFDISNPLHFDSSIEGTIENTNDLPGYEVDYFSTVFNFLEFAAESNGTSTIVIPAIAYVDALKSGNAEDINAVEDLIKDFVRNVLTHPGGNTVAAFEIGNEYPAWMGGHNGDMLDSHSEYALMMINFSVWIQEAIDDLAPSQDIDILGQVPFYLHGPLGTRQLVREILETDFETEYSYSETLLDAALAIDGFTFHAYSERNWELSEMRGIDIDFQSIDAVTEAFNDILSSSSSGSRDYEINVTEWNVRNSALKDESVSGMQEVTSFISTFHQLVKGGSDTMSAWPVLQNTQNTMAGGSDIEELALQPIGSTFRHLSENVTGSGISDIETHYDIDEDGIADFLIYSFESDGQFLFYLLSASDSAMDITVDFGDFISWDYSVTGERWFMESDSAVSGQEMLEIHQLTTGELEELDSGDAVFDISLDPWEVGFLEINRLPDDAAESSGDSDDPISPELSESSVLPGTTDPLEVTGDHQSDGPSVTAQYALEVLRLAVGLEPSWGAAEADAYIAADINGDGKVTAQDALDLLRNAVGLETEHFPEWVFMDDAADLAAIIGENVDHESDVDGAAMTSGLDESMTDVLLGSTQEYL